MTVKGSVLAERRSVVIARHELCTAAPVFDSCAVRELFDALAPTYWLNRLLSLGLTSYWRKRCVAVARVEQASSVCDLFTGTGDVLTLLRRVTGPDAHLTAVDSSPRMLERAAARKGTDAVLLCEDVRSTSLTSDSFEAITCCFGWKLLPATSVPDVIREIDRLLMPGGRFAAVELVRPDRPALRIIQRVYLSIVIGIASLVSSHSRLHKTLTSYVERFHGFEITSEQFRHRGYAVSEISLTLGAVKLFCATKPRKAGSI